MIGTKLKAKMQALKAVSTWMGRFTSENKRGTSTKSNCELTVLQYYVTVQMWQGTANENVAGMIGSVEDLTSYNNENKRLE